MKNSKIFYNPDTNKDVPIDYKKKMLIRRFFIILENAVFWVIIGFAVSTISLTYVLTDAFKQIDKIMVCK